MRIIEVGDASGQVIAPGWLTKAESVHRQLRPGLPADYAGRMAQVLAAGARMCVEVAAGTETETETETEEVICVAVWRVIENTYEGRRLYVDDLVSDESRRSRGAGKAMLDWLEARARQLGCGVLALDSGVQRSRAHHFYFREGMHIPAFCFRKGLE